MPDDLDQRIREVVRSAIGATPPAPPLPEGRSWGGRVPALNAVIATLVVVALAVTGVALVRDGSESSVDTRGAHSRCREKEPLLVLEGRELPVSGSQLFLEPLPPGPVDGRTVAGAVWTGDDVMVWGSRSDAPAVDEGTSAAAYDPGTRIWREIPDVPATFRSDNAGGTTITVWTGREMLIWGEPPPGAPTVNAVAYNPKRDRWRQLPRAPVEAASGLVAVWTGREMFAWGGRANVGAAYNPCTNRWRRIAVSPLETRGQATAVWTGSEVLIFGGQGPGNTPLLDGASYNPRTDSWRSIPAAPARGYYAHSAAWSGHEMIVWGWSNLARDRAAENETVAYDPQDNEWRQLQRAPLVPFPPDQQGEGTGGSVAFWAGDRMLAWSGTLDAEGPLVLEYRPNSDRWTRLGRAPDGSRAYFPSVLWTGTAMIVFGAGPEGQALSLTTRV